MTLTVPNDIAEAATTLAHARNTTAAPLLLQALAAHFPPLPDDLHEEFEMWEADSDEDMERFLTQLESVSLHGIAPGNML